MNKRDLVEKIGSLSRGRMRQILDGVRLLTEPRNVDEPWRARGGNVELVCQKAYTARKGIKMHMMR